MMFGKNHKKSGFSFIEIVIAIAIIGILLTSLFNLQNNVFNAATQNHSEIIRIFNLKNLFFDPELNKKILDSKQIKQNIDDPKMDLTYSLLPAKEQSTLKKMQNIYILKAIGKWSVFNKELQQELNLLLFNVKKESKANEKK